MNNIFTGCRSFARIGVFAFWSLVLNFYVYADTSLGLPPVNDASTKAIDSKIALGKKLFFDKRLSADNTISCSSCHIPEKAFTDGLPVAKGIGGKLGTRNTPSVLNAAFLTTVFWDGRRPSLEAQAADPIFNSREHALPNRDALLNFLRSDGDYQRAFFEAYSVKPEAISETFFAQAIAGYERSLLAGNSSFDRYYYGHDASALSESAVRGLRLFQGAAQCVSCHTIGPQFALFTDGEFHSLGIGFRRIENKLSAITTQVAHTVDASELDQLILRDPDIAELGRFVVTKQPRDIATFKTPSLRNVALTAPYMHDGSVATLADAVEFEVYYRSAEANKPLILTPLEKADLVSFLRALTSPELKQSQQGRR